MPNRDNIQMPTLEIPVEFDMASAERSMREIERRAKESGDESAKHIAQARGETKRWTDRLKDAASAAGGLALIIGNRLAGGFRGFGRVLGGILSTLVDVTAIGMMGASRGLRRLDDELEDNGRGWRAMGDAAGAAATALDGVARALTTVSGLMLGMQVATAAAAAALVVAAHRASSAFTPAWNRVLTMMETSAVQADILREKVSQMSAALGVDATEAADTLYEIFSRLPDLIEEPARAMEVLQVALEVGASGFADSATAAKAITAVLNSYNLEAEEARRVSDMLVAAQKQGALTFADVGNSIGRVAGLAANMGVELEELLGVIAALTPQGQNASEVITQLRAVLGNVLKPTAQAADEAERLGIQFNAVALESKGLVPFIKGIIDAADGSSESLAKLFGSQEAVALVVDFVERMEKVEEGVAAVGTEADQTRELMEQMAESWDKQTDRLRDHMEDNLRGIGLGFERMGIVGLKAINDVMDRMKQLDDFHRELATRMQTGLFARFAGEEPVADLEAITVSGVPPGRQPIPRPARPPDASFIRDSMQRIEELERLRSAAATAEFARTGDLEKYEQAIRATQVAVNDLVVAETARLREAGVAEQEIAKLASSYRVLREETDRTADAKRRLQEQLSDRVFRLTADAIDLEAQALDRLATEIKEKFGEIPEEMAAQLEQLRQNIERSRVLATLEEQFQALRRGPATLETADAMAALHDQLREEAEQLPENLQLREEYLELLHQIAEAIDRIRDAERKAQGATEDTAAREKLEAAERLRTLREQARTIEENARAGIQLAEAFGLIGSEAAAALEDVAQLGAAIFRIASGDLSAIPAAIGALASLVSGLFSGEVKESPAIRENNERLRELTAGIAELSQALAGISGESFAGVAAALQATIDAGMLGVNIPEVLRKELAQLGLTMDDVEEVARALGIEFDGSRKSMQQLLAAIHEFEFQQLFETLSGQLSLLRQEFEIMDIDDPIEQMKRLLDVIHQFAGADIAPPVWSLESEEGRKLARAWVQNMFRLIQSGEITPEQLGGLSHDEFRDFLEEFNRRLEEASEAAGRDGGLVACAEVTRVGRHVLERSHQPC